MSTKTLSELVNELVQAGGLDVGSVEHNSAIMAAMDSAVMTAMQESVDLLTEANKGLPHDMQGTVFLLRQQAAVLACVMRTLVECASKDDTPPEKINSNFMALWVNAAQLELKRIGVVDAIKQKMG